MLVFIRHAERGDNEFPQQHSEIQYDPPVTNDSKQTIEQVSKELSQLFRDHKITKINVMASKFLRCLMTAEGIIQHLSGEDLSIIEPAVVHNEITEYMRQDWFKEYPLNKLIFDSEHKAKYLKYCSWQQQRLAAEHPFPQNYVMFHARIGKFREKLRFPEEGECTIIITHGFVVRQLCWRMNQVPNYTSEIKYCGFAAFKHNGRQEVLLKSKL